MRAELRKDALLPKTQMVSLAYDAFSTDLETGIKSDAIIVELEHRDGTSVKLTYNYMSVLGEVVVERFVPENREPTFFVDSGQ